MFLALWWLYFCIRFFFRSGIWCFRTDFFLFQLQFMLYLTTIFSRHWVRRTWRWRVCFFHRLPFFFLGSSPHASLSVYPWPFLHFFSYYERDHLPNGFCHEFGQVEQICQVNFCVAFPVKHVWIVGPIMYYCPMIWFSTHEACESFHPTLIYRYYHPLGSYLLS